MDAAGLPDNLLSPAATRDPYGALSVLQAREPVHWSEPHRAWLVTRYADVAAALTDRRLSSDRARPLLAGPGGRAGQPAAAEVLATMAEWMVLSDAPAHTRLRRLAAGAFRAQRIAALSGRIERLVGELLDDFVASGQTDLIAHIAYPLPATIIAELLGAPPADRDRFQRWSDELALVAFGAGGDARPDRHERALGGLREMFGYFSELAEQRRREPGTDMLSALLEGDGAGGHLSQDELLGMCALLLFAGHETTTNSLANAILTLLRHPGQLARLRAEPELIATAVEELLRVDGPIKVLVRHVTEDMSLGGRSLRRGERAYLVIAAANRDPGQFTAPDLVDLGRSPNRHLAFGKGIHACIGAQLARLEMRIALTQITQRLPELRLTGAPVEWQPSLASRAMTALHLAHTGPSG